MVVKVEGLAVAYSENTVLSDISFEVADGQFICLVGSSGAGKSTLLHALAGFIPSSGAIVAPDHYGFIFQNGSVYPFLTVEQNVRLGTKEGGPIERYRIVSEALSDVGLLAKRKVYPSQLSGGQSQRVAIARVLATRPAPKIIYCDEPFGALDIFTREQMQELLLTLWEKHQMTVIFVTHSVDEAVFLSDRILILSSDGLTRQLEVDFPRPRQPSIRLDPRFLSLQRDIIQTIRAF